VRPTFPPSGFVEHNNGVESGDVIQMQLHRLDVASGQN
jgi:hypothetical protein